MKSWGDQSAARPPSSAPTQIVACIWMDRLAAREHGNFTSLPAPDAIAAAAIPEPPLPSEPLEGDPALGATVSITPIDYGRDNPSIGTLMSIDARRMVLQHHNEHTGLVTVHFSQFGYTVRA